VFYDQGDQLTTGDVFTQLEAIFDLPKKTKGNIQLSDRNVVSWCPADGGGYRYETWRGFETLIKWMGGSDIEMFMHEGTGITAWVFTVFHGTRTPIVMTDITPDQQDELDDDEKQVVPDGTTWKELMQRPDKLDGPI
jgi:hypothetical protein